MASAVSGTRRWLLVALGLLAAAGGATWWWSQPRSDEDRVRAAIEQVAEGGRTADLAMTLEPISRRYHAAEEEGVGYDDLKAWLYLQFQRRGPLSVLLGPIDVEVQGDRARARFDATVAEFSRERMSLLPDNADAFRFEVQLEREDGDWKVVTHTREAFSATRVGVPR